MAKKLRKHTWSELNRLQLGRYAEYLVKMEFALHGFDVYSSEIDDRGIDFVVRKDENTYYDIQVKSATLPRGDYIFLPKEKFNLRKNLLAAIVIFRDGEMPELYLIPSLAWKQPDDLLAEYNYKEKKSRPEWGLRLSRKNLPLLSRFAFEKVIKTL